MATTEIRNRAKAEADPKSCSFVNNKTIQDLVDALPYDAIRPSYRKATTTLVKVLSIGVLAYVGIIYSPWFLLPLAWLIAGTAITGVAAVAYDCSRDTFVRNKFLNEITGIVCTIPLWLPYYSWSERNKNQSSQFSLSETPFWFLSSSWQWMKANIPQKLDGKMVVNLICLYTFVCLFFPLMAYNFGIWSIFKYYVMPMLVYHFWMSSFMKSHSIFETDELGVCEYPLWVEWLSNNFNYAWSSLKDKAEVPTYNMKATYKSVKEQWDNTNLADEVSFGYEWLTATSKKKMERLRELKDETQTQLKSISFSDIEWTTTAFLMVTPVLAFYGLLTSTVYWQTWILGVVTYCSGGMAITAGYHRLFSHRSYDAAAIVRYSFALLACQTFEGSVLDWCKDHRAHHRYTDTNDDPYNAKRGFFYSHIGWLLVKRDRYKVVKSNITDLQRDGFLQFQHNYYVPLAFFMGFIMPCLVAGFCWGDFYGGFFIAGVLSTVATMHCTFFINSLAHFWGEYTFSDQRTPVDNHLISFLTFGEGYHNFHHEFPYDYRNGIDWYAFDPSKWLVWALEKLGMAYNVKRFDHTLFEKGRLQMKHKALIKRMQKQQWGPEVSSLPFTTWEELQKRRGDEANFVVVDNVVHDINEFLDLHPAGRGILLAYLGRDATKAFNGGVYNHSNAARNALATMRFARLHEDDVAPEELTHP